VRSLAYFAIFDPSRGQGIQRKIEGFLAAARAEGWVTRSVLEHRRGLRAHLAVGVALARSTDDVLVVRSTAHHLAVLSLFSLLTRRRSLLLLDVPTPHAAALLEVLRGRYPLLARLRMALFLVVTGPSGYWPFDQVVQCAPEGGWWMLGNRRRTRMVGNGIDVAAVPARERSPAWPAETLDLIGVANVSFWHGYDRVLRAMVAIPTVRFTIVGAGDEVAALKALAARLGLCGRVRFTGPLEGLALAREYEAHHVAVASLGLHRKGLAGAAELKAREYCAVGIPFIASGADLDFPDGVPFRHVVSSTERTDDVETLLQKLSAQPAFPPPGEIRRYAASNLDMRRKVRLIMDGLTPEGAP
jgi:glycosyltransferase involved in cell wall biosynthesis